MSEELDNAWSKMRAELRGTVPDATFATWLDPLKPISVDGERLLLSVPDRTLSWVGERYLGIIERAARHAHGKPVVVELVPASDAAASDTKGPRARPEPRGLTALNPRYTFDGFVISEGSRLAHAAALAVAEQPGLAYNPLFLHGPPGLGKTHLLHAIGHYVAAFAGDLRVAYTTVETFTAELVAATRSGDFTRFHARFRDVDVLLVDDVQFLARRTGTMEAFFHTFDALHASGRQLVLTSDRPPAHVAGLEDRLRERFRWGLVAAVEPPGLTARATILRKRVRLDGISGMDDATLVEVARLAPESIRSIEGALVRLVAYTSLTREPATPELAQRVLGTLAAKAQVSARPPTIDEVKRATAGALDLTPETIDAPGRRSRETFARQVAMYLARELTTESLPAIGASFGGRRHTTVVHACRKIERELSERPQARELVDNLRARLSATGDDRVR